MKISTIFCFWLDKSKKKLDSFLIKKNCFKFMEQKRKNVLMRRNQMKALLKTALTFFVVSVMGFSVNAGTLEDVKSRGELRCVVSTGIAGFAAPDDSGTWKGFDIDFCRATAAAVLGNADHRKITR